MPVEGGLKFVVDVRESEFGQVAKHFTGARFVVTDYYGIEPRHGLGRAPDGWIRVGIERALHQFTRAEELDIETAFLTALATGAFRVERIGTDSWHAGDDPGAGVREPRRPLPSDLRLAGRVALSTPGHDRPDVVRADRGQRTALATVSGYGVPMTTWVAAASPRGGPTDASCTHLDAVADVQPSTTEGCADCLREGTGWVHLRECLECGHVGCCDSSPNRHASAHWHATQHPIMRSFEPGEEWGWCFPDELFLVPA